MKRCNVRSFVSNPFGETPRRDPLGVSPVFLRDPRLPSPRPVPDTHREGTVLLLVPESHAFPTSKAVDEERPQSPCRERQPDPSCPHNSQSLLHPCVGESDLGPRNGRRGPGVRGSSPTPLGSFPLPPSSTWFPLGPSPVDTLVVGHRGSLVGSSTEVVLWVSFPCPIRSQILSLDGVELWIFEGVRDVGVGGGRLGWGRGVGQDGRGGPGGPCLESVEPLRGTGTGESTTGGGDGGGGSKRRNPILSKRSQTPRPFPCPERHRPAGPGRVDSDHPYSVV